MTDGLLLKIDVRQFLVTISDHVMESSTPAATLATVLGPSVRLVFTITSTMTTILFIIFISLSIFVCSISCHVV